MPGWSLLVAGSAGSEQMVDIDQLTNEEIRDQLMVHGCDPGPVIGSTRNVYANKLRRLLEGGSESSVTVPSESVVSGAARADAAMPSPKHRDTSHTPQKSPSPRRVTRSSAQETSDNHQNTPIISKTSRVSSKAADVPPALSRIISDSKQPSPKARVVQPSVPISSKQRADLEFDSRTDVNPVPKLHHSPLKTSITSDPSSLNIISDSGKIPKSYPFGTVPEVSRTTPTARFTSLRDNWGNQKVSDSSDDDLRGEESSRILSPNWEEDHTYSTRYDSEQRSRVHRLGENSAAHYSSASRYSSGVAFENSYNGYGNRRNDLKAKKETSPSYGKIGLMLLFIITAVIFVFFVMQNYAELERGEGNKEEF